MIASVIAGLIPITTCVGTLWILGDGRLGPAQITILSQAAPVLLLVALVAGGIEWRYRRARARAVRVAAHSDEHGRPFHVNELGHRADCAVSDYSETRECTCDPSSPTYDPGCPQHGYGSGPVMVEASR